MAVNNNNPGNNKLLDSLDRAPASEGQTAMQTVALHQTDSEGEQKDDPVIQTADSESDDTTVADTVSTNDLGLID